MVEKDDEHTSMLQKKQSTDGEADQPPGVGMSGKIDAVGLLGWYGRDSGKVPISDQNRPFLHRLTRKCDLKTPIMMRVHVG